VSASVERIRGDIDTIASFSSSGPGTNRLTFTAAYWAAVDFVAGQLAEMDYERRTTVHGNTRFRPRGAGWDVPAVTVGSHLDAVPDGGRFDGVAGVVAAVEIARIADAAMVFVPSIGGRSHCPEEDTPCEAIALATDVIFQAALLECGAGV
jgi:acetylornithine deacetylase/succinyl-diaminopimelate desuccinylase-like protein